MKKIFMFMIIGLFLCSSIVLAETDFGRGFPYSQMSVWGQFKFNLRTSTSSTFTVYGDERACEPTPEWSQLITPESSGTRSCYGMLNVYRVDSSWSFIKEIGQERSEWPAAISWSTYTYGDGTQGIQISGSSMIYPAIALECYRCPYQACETDSHCVAEGFTDCDSTYGACYTENCVPDWSEDNCGSWDECYNYKQFRLCGDGCGDTNIEEQSCATPPPETHKICSGTSCVTIEGAGADGCNTNLNCEAPTECIDSDGGQDYFTAGTVTLGTPYEDICTSGGTEVLEYYCENNLVKFVYEPCTNGCENGACRNETLPPPPPTEGCFDSDGGVELFIKGTVTDDGELYGEDYCVDATHVKEYSCHWLPFVGTKPWDVDYSKSGYVCEEGRLVERQLDLDAIITDIQYPSKVEAGESLTVSFTVKNQGEKRNYIVEAGVIPTSTASDWGLETMTFWDFTKDFLREQHPTICCAGQPNVYAANISLSTTEVEDFKMVIPKVPYEGIADFCYDNEYWDGEGDYTLYIIVKTACYPDGLLVAQESRTIEIGKKDVTLDCKDPLYYSDLITDLYTPTQKDITDTFCVDRDDCCPKEGFKVGCVREEKFEDEFGLAVSKGPLRRVSEFLHLEADKGICVATAEGDIKQSWFLDDSLLGQGIPNVVALLGGFFVAMMFMQMIGGMGGKK